MTAAVPNKRDRVGAAAATALVQLVFGYALLAWLVPDAPRAIGESLKLFDIAPEAPPPKPEVIPPHPKPSIRREGAASPPNLRARATEVVAPEPVIRLPVPPPIAAASVAATGSQSWSGSADVRGPGAGAGGQGNGFGSGGAGDGDGDGGRWTPPRQVAGRIKDSDYPRAADQGSNSGTVSVKYQVWIDGRVTDCLITRSSGSRVLDETTCRLIRERFRFKPARDEDGEPSPIWVVSNHEWIIAQEPPERR